MNIDQVVVWRMRSFGPGRSNISIFQPAQTVAFYE